MALSKSTKSSLSIWYKCFKEQTLGKRQNTKTATDADAENKQK